MQIVNAFNISKAVKVAAWSIVKVRTRCRIIIWRFLGASGSLRTRKCRRHIQYIQIRISGKRVIQDCRCTLGQMLIPEELQVRCDKYTQEIVIIITVSLLCFLQCKFCRHKQYCLSKNKKQKSNLYVFYMILYPKNCSGYLNKLAHYWKMCGHSVKP